jgi:hypothetical protein
MEADGKLIEKRQYLKSPSAKAVHLAAISKSTAEQPTCNKITHLLLEPAGAIA